MNAGAALRPGDLLSVAQALALLPVGRTMLYSLLADGSIPSIRVATVGSRRGRLLVRRDGLEAFVAALHYRHAAPPVPRGRPSVDVDALRARVLRRAP